MKERCPICNCPVGAHPGTLVKRLCNGEQIDDPTGFVNSSGTQELPRTVRSDTTSDPAGHNRTKGEALANGEGI